jgi:hypothetical protein
MEADSREGGTAPVVSGATPGQVIGPIPRFPGMPRWVGLPVVPDVELPPIPSYECRRTVTPPPVDGSLAGPWERATWSAPFGRIDTGLVEGPATEVALLWDDDHLYAGFRVEDPDIRASASVHHEQVYVKDDDVEIFVEGVGGYYELGVNPINTVYEFRWTWVEPLVQRRDHQRIDELFSVADFVYYRARPGERLGRVGEMDWDLPGLRHAVRIDGTLNLADDIDTGWTVTVALPWRGLQGVSRDGQGFPPRAGDTLRIQAYRARHDRSGPGVLDPDGSTEITPFVGNTWSTMGNHDPHDPARWVPVRFVDEPA